MNPPLNIAENLKIKKDLSIKKITHTQVNSLVNENSNKISMNDCIVQQITSINGISADPSRTVYMS